MEHGEEPDGERASSPVALARNRAVWQSVNEQFTDGAALERWSDPALRWGLFGHPESELGALGPVAGLDVVEVGCGSAFVAAWLARQGARPIGVDLSREQLGTARRCQGQVGPAFPLVEADGGRLPLATASCDLVVSEYGAAPWCDPRRWVPEAARVLRPGGRLVFLTHSPLAALCVPDEPGPAGDRLLRSPHDLDPVAWPGGGVEHHPGHGEWIRLLVGSGLAVEALRELTPPPGAEAHRWYDIVTPAWAGRWPAEDLWVARLPAADGG